MTINVQIDAVTTAIAGLSVSGVTLLDMDKVPENAIDYCPCLYPTPDNFVTDVVFTRKSTGGDSYAKMDLAYTLHYRYLHAPIGSGAVLQNYAGILSNLELILEAILGNSTPSDSVDMQLVGVSDLGPAIRQRMETPEGRGIMEMLKTRPPLREPSQVTDRHASWMAANWAAIWQFSGDKEAAARARTVLMNDVIVKPMPPDRKEIHHATRLLGIALAYDLCHDAWDEDFRRLVAEYLHVAATDLALGFNEGFRMESDLYDPEPAGHRNAIRMACVGCAAMAIEGDVDSKGKPFTGLEPIHRAAERHVIRKV